MLFALGTLVEAGYHIVGRQCLWVHEALGGGKPTRPRSRRSAFQQAAMVMLYGVAPGSLWRSMAMSRVWNCSAVRPRRVSLCSLRRWAMARQPWLGSSHSSRRWAS